MDNDQRPGVGGGGTAAVLESSRGLGRLLAPEEQVEKEQERHGPHPEGSPEHEPEPPLRRESHQLSLERPRGGGQQLQVAGQGRYTVDG